MSSLTSLLLTPGNTQLACAGLCFSSVPVRSLPSTICVNSPQDTGLCSFIAATNIQTTQNRSMWSCTTAGATATDPCSTSWYGLGCVGGSVVSITGDQSSIVGMFYCIVCIFYSSISAGTIPLQLFEFSSLTYFSMLTNQLSG